MRRAFVLALLMVVFAVTTPAQSPTFSRTALTAGTADLQKLRQSDATITALRRSGQLVSLSATDDALVPDVRHERLRQHVHGIPVWGSVITVRERNGVPISVFGDLLTGLDAVDTTATVSADEARAVAGRAAGVTVGPFAPADLFIRAVEGSEPRLVYVVRAMTPALKRMLYFIDAQSGQVLEARVDSRSDAAVGVGTGVLRDRKKVSASRLGSLFVLVDELRPTPIRTYDLRGDSARANDILNGVQPFLPSDLASDDDNTWTDPALVDAHVYTGLTYDYLYKRFGMNGIDNRGLVIQNIVHPVFRTDIEKFIGDVGGVNDTPLEVPDFFVNAGYMGNGIVVYGDGLPPGFVLVTPNGDQAVDYLSGAIDIVAHEITHGVTEFSSNLEFLNEAGALNEAFSDIIGTSVEFFFQPAGSGEGRADYVIAEDILDPGAARSLASPTSLSQPDHYRNRFIGTQDSGGVHINSGIPNNAFYLAIEGGTNATSGITVTGVGAANRDQIEKVFFRAFTQLLPEQATFSTARAATIQSAVDLYGAGSAAAQAVAAAWTAVGVQ